MFRLEDSALTFSRVAVWSPLVLWEREKQGGGQLGGMGCKYRHQIPSRVGVPVFAFGGKRKPKCDY